MAKGDRLRVERRFAGSTVIYMHHGIDVGDGTVVHARPANFSRPLAGGSVVRTSLAEFAGGSPVLATSAATLALAGIPGGPAGMVGGALAGAAIWAGGSLAFHVWNHSAGRSSASGTR
ncbi:MAG: lecithin retinol acyltransferase family protein [Planctomycetota bacterium]